MSYSKQNNLITMTGSSKNGMYTTHLSPVPQANLSMHTSHFQNLHDMVYYFFLVFNCPRLEAYCKLVSSSDLIGLPKSLTCDVVGKYYPHHDHINSWAQLSKKPIPNNPEKVYELTFCSEQVEIDILMISTSTSSIPKSTVGYRHVVMVVDSFSSSLSYVQASAFHKSHYPHNGNPI